MPKMKTKKAVTKRLKLTSSGKIKRLHANRRHKAWSKTSKRSRHARKTEYASSSDVKRIRHLFQ